MKRSLPVLALLCLLWLGYLPTPVAAASRTSTFTGSGWTLTLTYRQAAYGQTMDGSFHSAHQSFPVHGDWIPAGDAGSDLLRFYGHPFGAKSPLGLVGLATLSDMCTPNCAASRRYKLAAVALYPQTPAKLPGVGKASLVVLVH